MMDFKHLQKQLAPKTVSAEQDLVLHKNGDKAHWRRLTSFEVWEPGDPTNILNLTLKLMLKLVLFQWSDNLQDSGTKRQVLTRFRLQSTGYLGPGPGTFTADGWPWEEVEWVDCGRLKLDFVGPQMKPVYKSRRTPTWLSGLHKPSWHKSPKTAAMKATSLQSCFILSVSLRFYGIQS